ncbi:MAG: PorV/PorQ family protein [Bacteroidota bacterium]|nr:PorV/PorQ family protein [Bacteroidota bacterium]MDE2835475.1 PorV/PorQ family protein [Bacteroidota bacterium]MDE2955587.1 PorV/PorQ family protein [Bacteroidota bacterium]
MKRLTFLFASILVVTLGAAPAHAQFTPDPGTGLPPNDFNRAGQAGFQFLKLPTNARQAGMGGVISSLGQGDAASSFTNPASLVDVTRLNLGLTAVRWFANINYYSAAAARYVEGVGIIGVSFLFLDYGDMPRTENRPILVDGIPTGRSEVLTDLGTVTAQDLAVGISYARRVTEQLHFGINAKYISETLDDATVGAWAVDIGTVFYTGIRSLRVTMVGRNIGPDTQIASFDERIGYEPADVRMPVNFSFGAAYDLVERGESGLHHWTVAAEFVHPNDGAEKVNFGTEYTFRNLFSVRGGYRFNYDEEGFTLGTGLNVGLSSYTLNLGYAFWEFGLLGSVHVVSMGFGL